MHFSEETIEYGLAVILFVTLILSLAGNTVVLVSVCARRIKSPTASLLKGTTVAGVGISVFIILPSCINLATGSNFLENRIYCSLQGCFGQCFLIINVLFMYCQTCERLSIFKRNRFKSLLTTHFNSICIGIVMTAGLLSGFPMVDAGFYIYRVNILHCVSSNNKFAVFILVVAYTLPAMVTTFVSCSLLKLISKQQNRIHAERNASTSHGQRNPTTTNRLSVRNLQPACTLGTQRKSTKSNHLHVAREHMQNRPSIFASETSTLNTGLTQGGIPKNEMRSAKALTCINIPVSICYVSSIAFRYLGYPNEENKAIYGALCTVSISIACALQPLITVCVSSAIRKSFRAVFSRSAANNNTRVFRLTLETPHPREKTADQIELPEFLRPRSGMRIQLEVVQGNDPKSPCRTRKLSAISMLSDGISIIDIDECVTHGDTDNGSGSIGSLVCQADACSRSPTLSTMSNLTLNITDLQLTRQKPVRGRCPYRSLAESSPSSQFSFFSETTHGNDMIHRTSSLPTIRISSPRTPKTPGRKFFRRVIPMDKACTLDTVEDVMSTTSTPRSSEIKKVSCDQFDDVL